MQPELSRSWMIEAIAPVWTGNESNGGSEFKSTGLLGSIRWWVEVVARGSGGTACDPSDSDNRCPDKTGKRCVVCELFGCTSWSRKFRFDVRLSDGGVAEKALAAGDRVELRFVALRPLEEEEWMLLNLALICAADYGAIGGKTVLKPTDERARAQEFHHKDFGLIKVEKVVPPAPMLSAGQFEAAMRDKRFRSVNQNGFAWASLGNFWCVPGRYLSRQDADRSNFNGVVGREQSKKCVDCGQVHDPRQRCPRTGKQAKRFSDRQPPGGDRTGRWLAGSQQESKKVLSFKTVPRTFGFVNPPEVTFEELQRRLKSAWSDLKTEEFIRGREILRRLLEKHSIRA